MSINKWKAGLLAGLSILAIGSAAQAGEVRMTVAEYSSKTGPYFEEVKKAFEAANPGITLNFEVVPWDVLLQKLTTDISAGTNADLSIIGTRWLIDFVQQGIAEPLDGYMDDSFKGRFIETFLSPSVLEGKTYGLPIAASARAMYYNKELLEKQVSPILLQTGMKSKLLQKRSRRLAVKTTVSAFRARKSKQTFIIIMRCGRRVQKSSTRMALLA